MDLHAVVAKARKYATLESGDTLEMIERPGGGMSWVLVDGQRSGRAAKSIANLVARKAVGLLAEACATVRRRGRPPITSSPSVPAK